MKFNCFLTGGLLSGWSFEPPNIFMRRSSSNLDFSSSVRPKDIFVAMKVASVVERAN